MSIHVPIVNIFTSGLSVAFIERAVLLVLLTQQVLSIHTYFAAISGLESSCERPTVQYTLNKATGF